MADDPVSKIEKQLEELNSKFSSLANRTHAGSAIIAAGIVEDWIQAILIGKMRPLSKTFKALLFKGYGPLNSFSAKLHVCYALNFIDEGTYKDIQVIKKVRNEFSHTLVPLSFENDEIKKICRQFSLHKKTDSDFLDLYSRTISEIIRKLQPIQQGTNFANALRKFMDDKKPASDQGKP